MNLRINHSPIIPIELTKQYGVSDFVDAPKIYRSNARHSAEGGVLVPEIVPWHNIWCTVIQCIIYLWVGISITIYLIDSGAVDIGFNPKNAGFLENYYFLLLIEIIPTLIACYLVKKFCGIRHLLFQGDKAILQGRWDGKRVYETKDLRFHLLTHFPNKRKSCTLEIELPDQSLPERKRMFIIEATATREVMDGILHGLLPLLRGDPSIAQKAKRRPYHGIPLREGLRPIHRILNFDDHISTWITYGKINQFLFWLVHGGPKKVLSLPINQKVEGK